MSDFQDQVFIYALLDPADKKPFYVGSTRMSLSFRLSGHIAESLSDTMPNTPKCRKVRDLLDHDLRPLIEPLEECEGGYRAVREKYWHHILQEDGATLTNSATIARVPKRRHRIPEPEFEVMSIEMLSWVISASEAEQLYSLPPGTVAQAIKERRLPSREGGLESIICTIHAEKLWGKK